jgi:hypothetical protein
LGYLPYLPGGNVLGSLLTFGSEYAFNASLFRILEGALAPGLARGVVAALLASWIVWVALSQPRVAIAGALAFAGLLVLSPTVHVWYLTWFLVFLPAVGARPWTWPLLAWCCMAVLPSWTYHLSSSGEPFREFFALTWLEYAPPFLLAAWLLRRRRPRRIPPEEPASGARREFSVVIPARGEIESLRPLLPAWTASGASEVIVADLPTGDGTRELCSDQPGVRYLPVEQRGYGAAVLAGMEAAESEFMVVSDADHDAGPRQVDALLAPFGDPAVGLVSAARTDPGALSLSQRFGNALATLLIELGWGRRFHDLGPFRALRRGVWPDGALSDTGFGFNVEMNVRALERGLKIVEVALPAGRRRHGEDRISGTLRGVLGAGYGILRRLYRLREQSCRLPS